MATTTVRLKPILHECRRVRVNPRFQSQQLKQKRVTSTLHYSKKILSVGSVCKFKPRVSIRAASSVQTSVEAPESADTLFSETFQLKRTETVEGKVSVRLDHGEQSKNWQLSVGCDLPGKWVLHWGVTYCDDLSSEWDQPPREMIPSGSVPIKGYAIETPLKKSQSAVEGQMLHEVQIDSNCDTPISAIHFVLKEEETGAWYQHRGRDFRVRLTDYLQEDDGVVDDKKGFSIWSGNIETHQTAEDDSKIKDALREEEKKEKKEKQKDKESHESVERETKKDKDKKEKKKKDKDGEGSEKKGGKEKKKKEGKESLTDAGQIKLKLEKLNAKMEALSTKKAELLKMLEEAEKATPDLVGGDSGIEKLGEVSGEGEVGQH